MRVRIISFGTNWWGMHGRDLDDPHCFHHHAAWFNSAALKCGHRIRLCWAYPGHIRFNQNSGFQPEFPFRSIGKTFLCVGPNRLNGLLSAGDAAEQAALPHEAGEFYRAAAQQTDFGKDSQRPELAHAVEIVRKTTGAQPTVAGNASR